MSERGREDFEVMETTVVSQDRRARDRLLRGERKAREKEKGGKGSRKREGRGLIVREGKERGSKR